VLIVRVVRLPYQAPTRPPWFRRHPALAVGVAVVVFCVVLWLRLLLDDPGQLVELFYALPVALLTVTHGRRGGALAGLLVSGLLVLGGIVDPTSLNLLGWCGRLLALLLLAGLLGDATDRLRRAEARQLRLEQVAQRQRDAAEVNDALVQSLSAAKWALEAGDLERGLRIITETGGRAQQLVTDLLRDADDARTTQPPRR
jgi:hypothetical protein